jgi:hypothetical protein
VLFPIKLVSIYNIRFEPQYQIAHNSPTIHPAHSLFRVAHPLMLKQGLWIWQILLRLGIYSFGNCWHFAQWFGRPLAYRGRHIKKPAKICRLWHIRQNPLGRPLAYRGRQRYMPMVGPTIARSVTIGKLDAEL